MIGHFTQVINFLNFKLLNRIDLSRLRVFGRRDFQENSGHFETRDFLYRLEIIFQIAWDQTSKMGIAMASNEKATYVVAQYYTRKIFL